MFARLDANKDGKLDAADRAAKRAERQAKRFARLDADGDGSISKAEWDQHGADRAAKRAERGEKCAAAGEAGQGKRHAMRGQERKSVVSGKSVSVSGDLGGRRIIKKKQNISI